VIDDAVEERLEALDAAVEELCEDLRVVVNRDVPLLKGTVRAIVDEDVESVEDFPDAGCAFGRRVNDLDATVTALAARLDRLQRLIESTL